MLAPLVTILQVRKVSNYELSWNLSDPDNAAGLACDTEEVSVVWFFSSPFDSKALNSPSPLIESALSFLIPSVLLIWNFLQFLQGHQFSKFLESKCLVVLS